MFSLPILPNNTLSVLSFFQSNISIFIARNGVTLTNPVGSYWTSLPTTRRLSMIDYGANGEIVGITKEGDVVSLLNNRFKILSNGFKSVSVGFYGYWLVNNRNIVYFATYVPSQNVLSRLNIIPIRGQFKKVVAGFGGDVWALDLNNRVYRRLKVNTLNPSGTKWEKIEGLRLRDITVGYDGVYGITLNQKLLKSTSKRL